jgi:hypothetical protein
MRHHLPPRRRGGSWRPWLRPPAMAIASSKSLSGSQSDRSGLSQELVLRKVRERGARRRGSDWSCGTPSVSGRPGESVRALTRVERGSSRQRRSCALGIVLGSRHLYRRRLKTKRTIAYYWCNTKRGRLFQLDLGQLYRNIVLRPLVVEISDDSQCDDQCDDNQRSHPTSSLVY